MLRAFCVFLILSVTSAFSQNDPENFSKYGIFYHNPEIPNALFLFGEIDQRAAINLRNALRNHDIDLLVLDSIGGIVDEGLQIAAIIDDRKIDTYIPSKGIFSKVSGVCASACSYIYLAGDNRSSDGALGVHQFYGEPNQKELLGDSQKLVSEIIGFLNEFDTPPFVFEKMFSTSGNDMYFFNPDEMNVINAQSDRRSDKELVAINGFIQNLRSILLLSEIETQSDEKGETLDEPRLSKPEIISASQRELNRLGCSAGQADGVIGPRTRAALDRFNKATGSRLGYGVLEKEWFGKNLSGYEPIKDCYIPSPVKPKLTSVADEYQIACIVGDTDETAVLKTDHFDPKSKTGVFYIDWKLDRNFDGFINFAIKKDTMELRDAKSSLVAQIQRSSDEKVLSFIWTIDGANCKQYVASTR